MQVSAIVEGLQIIEQSKPETFKGSHFRAEHDEIFAGSLEWSISEGDKARLEELGWMPDEDIDGWRLPV